MVQPVTPRAIVSKMEMGSDVHHMVIGNIYWNNEVKTGFLLK